MHEASRPLLGLQDFAAFCKRREGATTVRTLLELGWEPRAGRDRGRRRCVADAFCHSMVRSLVGAWCPSARAAVRLAWPLEVLAAARGTRPSW